MVIGHSFVFVHVPKTGGSSITAALGGRTRGYSLHRPLSAARLIGLPGFGFVRNPWDWLVSVYCYNNEDQTPEGYRRWLLNDRFYFKDDLRPFRHIPPVQRRSQMYWLEGCARIGRFERLSRDFASICRCLRIEPDPLEHLNKSAPRDFRAFYDEETVAFVAKHCAEEIDLFGYRWECS